MRWSERQQALLAEMGIRLWARAEAPAVPALSPAPAAATASGSAPAPAAARPDAAAMREAHEPPALRPPPGTREAPVAARVRESNAFDAPPFARAADAPPAAATTAGLGWPELREAVAGCTACRLCESRRMPICGAGPERAGWMIVGESPGEAEDERGEPFVGKPGELLDNMLRSIGLARGAAGLEAGRRPIYVTHAVKCRPPGSRVPQRDELAQCEHFLARQVELVQPTVILAMGTVAVQSLLRSTEPIGRLRGRVHRFHGVPLVVTYPPSYLLRNLQDKARAWDDLCLAAETAAAPPAA